MKTTRAIRGLLTLTLSLGAAAVPLAADPGLDRDQARRVRHVAVEDGREEVRAAVDLIIERGVLTRIVAAVEASGRASSPVVEGQVDEARVRELALELARREELLSTGHQVLAVYPDDRGDGTYNPVWAVVVRYRVPAGFGTLAGQTRVVKREVYVRVDSWRASFDYERLAL